MKAPIIPPKGVFYTDSYRLISKILDKPTSLVLWHRSIPDFVNGWLDLLKWANVSEYSLRVNSGNLNAFEVELSELINSWGRRSPDMSDWIIEDIYALTSQFISSTGAENILLRVTPNYSGNSNLDIYERHLKLVTSYGQSGIFWRERKLNPEENAEYIFNILPLDVLLVKGLSWPGNENSSISVGINEVASDAKRILLELEYLD